MTRWVSLRARGGGDFAFREEGRSPRNFADDTDHEFLSAQKAGGKSQDCLSSVNFRC